MLKRDEGLKGTFYSRLGEEWRTVPEWCRSKMEKKENLHLYHFCSLYMFNDN